MIIMVQPPSGFHQPFQTQCCLFLLPGQGLYLPLARGALSWPHFLRYRLNAAPSSLVHKHVLSPLPP